LKRALYPRASWGFWSLAYIQGIKRRKRCANPQEGTCSKLELSEGENERDWRLHHRVANGGSTALVVKLLAMNKLILGSMQCHQTGCSILLGSMLLDPCWL